MELTYTRKGDYLYPDLTLESKATRPMGKYGLLRKQYLKEHHPNLYQALLLTGKLDMQLVETEEKALEMQERIVNELLKMHPAPDKETDQLGWTAYMNSLMAMTEEIVLHDLI